MKRLMIGLAIVFFAAGLALYAWPERIFGNGTFPERAFRKSLSSFRLLIDCQEKNDRGDREGEAPAEPQTAGGIRLGRSLALPPTPRGPDINFLIR